ncbi:alkyl/aryl-sulfatase [Streptomyces iconiensis]|uniref:Alkyl sulfatase dimerization domain-containing protein n=1 Tax=Streptomyces iconiensis TaxID=1384038 RepID=A0ABT6ZZJ6_9ACTN|nr:alkyl sulfatase dimerization domain-containing protein [Streptomyces iconiensis]MDJ1134229.1 alkyl sulfatase dimerization domain-containing protein [Streptomyces iconiensis]
MHGSTDRTPQPATTLTRDLNAAVPVPPWDEDAERALAAQWQLEELPADFTIGREDGKLPAWSLSAYTFLNEEAAPDTVNPSLWRNARLNMYTGLFEVVPNAVYQVRGMDLSNISFLEDPTGESPEIVVVDPLISAECAAAALKLYRQHRGQERAIRAVLFTHSHLDHYGGVLGLFENGELPEGVDVIAPEGFLEHSVSENVYAGNAMQRRAMFMYGPLLERSAQGQVDAGLGKSMSAGSSGLLPPTFEVTPHRAKKGHPHAFGPVNMEFQLTPGTEAPAEMNFYLPDVRTLCMAENATPTLHNLYSLRGAQVRDAKAWSEYLTQSIEWYADRSDTLFASHFWPRWKTEDKPDAIVSFLTSQADLYRFLHDQSLRLANQGRTMTEIAEDLDTHVPESLAGQWFNRGYYGTVNHDIKAVYQRYLGWYDGNAAHLHTLPPEAAGLRYVEAMGGAATVVALARQTYENAKNADDYRWAAELLSHAVFADPTDQDARHLEADVLEQLGYQAESGPWRNFYLAAAHELRTRSADGAPPNLPSPQIITPPVLAAMPLEMLFDYVGIRLNGPAAASHPLSFGLTVTGGLPDDPSECTVRLRNGVLVHTPRAADQDTADAMYEITRTGLNEFAIGAKTPGELYSEGALTIPTGTIEPFNRLNSLLETFSYWFGLTTP